MERAKIIDNMVHVWTDYQNKDLCKSINPHEWHKETKSWRYPLFALPDLVSVFPGLRYEPGIEEALRAGAQKKIAEDLSLHSTAPTHLYHHQKIAYSLALNRSAALFMDTGTGKTATVIAVIDQDLKDNPGSKYLVVAPLSILRAAWEQDVARFAPHLRVAVVAGDKAERAKGRLAAADIFVTNFESYRIDAEWWRMITFRALIVDESSKMKDPASQITKKLIEHSKLVPLRYAMSGTPAPNSPLEYWGQVTFVDPSILGKSFYGFRACFGTQVGYGGYTWVVTGEKLAKLQKLIGQVSYAVRKEDCLDLPDRIEVQRDVSMPPEQKQAYLEMKRTLTLEMKDGLITAANAAVKCSKLRQICSGFIYEDEEITHRFNHYKGNVLEEIMEEIGPTEQALIWYNFNAERDDIMAWLKDEKIENYCEDNRDSVERFKSGQTRILVANPASLGHGVTLVGCRYAIYYSLSYSLEQFHQSKDRIYRIGQTRKCEYFYLVCPGTIEVDVFRALRKKQTIADAMMDYLK